MAAHQQVKERWPCQPRAVRLIFLGLVTFITGTALLVATLYSKDADISLRGPNTTGEMRSWRGFPGSGPPVYHAPDLGIQKCSPNITIPKVCSVDSQELQRIKRLFSLASLTNMSLLQMLRSLMSMTMLQVALLFLTRGDMPHEASWAAWLASVQGMIPIDRVTESPVCGKYTAKCPGQEGKRAQMVCLVLASNPINILPISQSCFSIWAARACTHMYSCHASRISLGSWANIFTQCTSILRQSTSRTLQGASSTDGRCQVVCRCDSLQVVKIGTDISPFLLLTPVPFAPETIARWPLVLAQGISAASVHQTPVTVS